jgi:hypothetical protein
VVCGATSAIAPRDREAWRPLRVLPVGHWAGELRGVPRRSLASRRRTASRHPITSTTAMSDRRGRSGLGPTTATRRRIAMSRPAWGLPQLRRISTTHTCRPLARWRTRHRCRHPHPVAQPPRLTRGSLGQQTEQCRVLGLPAAIGVPASRFWNDERRISLEDRRDRGTDLQPGRGPARNPVDLSLGTDPPATAVLFANHALAAHLAPVVTVWSLTWLVTRPVRRCRGKGRSLCDCS